MDQRNGNTEFKDSHFWDNAEDVEQNFIFLDSSQPKNLVNE